MSLCSEPGCLHVYLNHRRISAEPEGGSRHVLEIWDSGIERQEIQTPSLVASLLFSKVIF